MSDAPILPQKTPLEETEAYLSLLREYWQGMSSLEKHVSETHYTFVRDRTESKIEFGDNAVKSTRETRKKIDDLRQRYDRGEL